LKRTKSKGRMRKRTILLKMKITPVLMRTTPKIAHKTNKTAVKRLVRTRDLEEINCLKESVQRGIVKDKRSNTKITRNGITCSNSTKVKPIEMIVFIKELHGKHRIPNMIV